MEQDGNLEIGKAVEALGRGPLTEQGIAAAVRPLFSRTLASPGLYLANHMLGRPLDQMQADVAEGTRVWAKELRGAWDPWLAEEQVYRAAIASLLGLTRPDCVIPKVSAGPALRTVLNGLPADATVLTTRGEFAAVSVVLAQYAAQGRVQVRFAEPDEHGRWTASQVIDALHSASPVKLVVLSHVFYADGQLLEGFAEIAAACLTNGAKLLVDCYHSLGIVPLSMEALGCDYLIGGCYKYLRGGPGAAFLALAPHVADKEPHDSGWFALEPGTDPWQSGGPQLRPGGEGWLDGSPAMLTYYQARSGLVFTQAIGVERLRAYSLGQLRFLKEELAVRSLVSEGGDTAHGAYLTVAVPQAAEVVLRLAEQSIVLDQRNGRLRVCPDCLTTREELARVAEAIGNCNDTHPS